MFYCCSGQCRLMCNVHRDFNLYLVNKLLAARLASWSQNDKGFFPTIYQEILSQSGSNARCVTPEKDRFLTINMIIHLCSFFKSYPYSATQSREFQILIWLIIFILIHKYWNTNFIVVSKIRLVFIWFSKKINWNKRISHHLF
jgi:hypothetical protein